MRKDCDCEPDDRLLWPEDTYPEPLERPVQLIQEPGGNLRREVLYCDMGLAPETRLLTNVMYVLPGDQGGRW